jgi:hypothetical protein
MKFVLTRSLQRDASLQKYSKNLKIVLDQVTLPKTGLVTPRTFIPLGVKLLLTSRFEKLNELYTILCFL